ncbi:DUF397 domain-containing protein [Streptomyces sp. 7-21]|jgi:hypothetical protein|uniref:DUF397 domain-containing protein n=1 Tax=Streptomyces sp. 7-21 TaxID=2802283 RepID=UPI00191F1CF3|nr:DUF397 domain-containing protein [Streptomyces sp. 7-21]MBL1068953.1 DUF397 domain-containing protein [Streptomyces sp. 7-21]
MSPSDRTAWQKSSYSSEGSACLELAHLPDDRIALRESDKPDTVLTTSPARLAGLLELARSHWPVA